MIEIKSTLCESPVTAIFYAKDGVGKSTLCASAPGAVFISVEGGLDNIDALAVPSPKTWQDVLDSVVSLSKDERCKTIVIDSLDWLEQLCWAHICKIGIGDGKSRNVSNIEAFGWGKGYTAALSEWRKLLMLLDEAKRHGKNVLMTAHATLKSVKNPFGEDYDAMILKMHEKAAGLLREWVDVVAYCELDIALHKENDRTKSISTGKRVMRCSPSGGTTTKTRYNLPEVLPLDWNAFASAIKKGRPRSVEALKATLQEKLATLDDPTLAAGCSQFLVERGETFASLSEAITTVDDYLKEKERKAEQ